MDRSKRMLFGLIAALIVLFTFVSLIAWPRPATNKCIPTLTKPPFNPVTLLISKDKTAMGDLVGYVEFQDNNHYLPLNIESISINILKDDDLRLVVFSGQCVTVNIRYKILDPGKYEYSSIEMFVKNDLLPDRSLRKICDFTHAFMARVYQPISHRYSCRQVMSHQCSSQEKDKNLTKEVAKLVLKSFELELDDDPASADEGEFKKRPWLDSCKHWQDDSAEDVWS